MSQVHGLPDGVPRNSLMTPEVAQDGRDGTAHSPSRWGKQIEWEDSRVDAFTIREVGDWRSSAQHLGERREEIDAGISGVLLAHAPDGDDDERARGDLEARWNAVWKELERALPRRTRELRTLRRFL